MKSKSVRGNIVKRMGVELLRGEIPGPMNASNPRVRRDLHPALRTRRSDRTEASRP
ncbi:hypothetical protein PROAA_1680011 [Candidatus Propionivibrio aalborgensis]|uniref:Uncharacterized protein n=1 Tax=Candidatus Propionivibrio aalborgensis TaxID=1860101 RepID=A0A1A8XPF6_9RHOO|nr:hypothetical protein PROAA_1680011 [Candidatus Propionivibrio aalborgensis]